MSTTKMVFHGSDIEKICEVYHLKQEIACGGFFIYKETLLRFLLLYIKARQIKNDRAGILFDLSASSE